MRGLFLFLAGIFCSLVIYGQSAAGRQAISRMEKGKWKSAEDLMRKAAKKDSLNPELAYLFSWYFSQHENPNASIDSSYRYATKAIQSFSRTTQRDRDRLKKFPIDSLVLIRNKQRADSLAFEHAREINTESSYAEFLSKFITARERSSATELRDELAFLDALKQNSPASFKEFLEKYPASTRAAEANERLDKLLYVEGTRDGTLAGYESFLAEYPNSIWSAEAEKNIFEIATASGRTSAFARFVSSHPKGRLRNKALAFIYHLTKDEDRDVNVLSDSLRQIQIREKGFWVPVIRNAKIGFMDQKGVETVNTMLDSIHSDYNCGNITSDFLQVAGGIMNRAGNWIVRSTVEQVTDLGSGFLKISRGACVDVVHKSGGEENENCFSDVKLVAHNFIAYRTNDKWGLRTLGGRVLAIPQYDDIQALDTIFIFIRNGKKTINTLVQVASLANKGMLNSSLVFDDCKRMSDGKYWVRNGALEGVLDRDLNFVVPLGRFSISKSPVGFVMEENKKSRVTGLSGVDENDEFDYVRFYGNWADLRQGKKITLYNLSKGKVQQQSDSLWFQNQLVFSKLRDSLTVFINASTAIAFPVDNKVSFLRSSDSTRYFFVYDKKKKTVYNASTGKRLFSFTGDGIEYIGHNTFVAFKGTKKGAYAADGKVLLPIEYNAIVPMEKQWLSLLKDGKFGIYYLPTRKLVKPTFSKNVRPFSPKLLVAYRDGGYGFVDMDSKPQATFEFEEIRSWNDTSALVKKNFHWMVYSLRSKRIRFGEIKEFKIVHESSQETIAIVRQGNYYGVISNRRGVVIPSTFSEIINLGSSEEPLFFSEKNVEEAGIHVVVYYDRNGKVIRKQALEEAEFEAIYCGK